MLRSFEGGGETSQVKCQVGYRRDPGNPNQDPRWEWRDPALYFYLGYSGVLMQVNVTYYTPKPNVVYIPAIKGETRNLHITRF